MGDACALSRRAIPPQPLLGRGTTPPGGWRGTWCKSRGAGPAGRPQFIRLVPDYSVGLASFARRLARPGRRRLPACRPPGGGVVGRRSGAVGRLVAGGVLGRRGAVLGSARPHCRRCCCRRSRRCRRRGRAKRKRRVRSSGASFQILSVEKPVAILNRAFRRKEEALYRRAKLCLDETPQQLGDVRSCLRDRIALRAFSFCRAGRGPPMDKAPQMEFTPFRIESWARTHRRPRPQP